MSIEFTCQKCNEGFEVDLPDLVDGSEKLECPNCGAKATQAQSDDFVEALTELKAQVATLSKKFAVTLNLETDDIDADDDDDDEEDDKAVDDDDTDDDEDEDDDDDDDDEVDDEDQDDR